MLELGQHCLEHTLVVSTFIREYYFDIVRLVVLRGELELGQLASDEHDAAQKSEKVMQEKAKVAEEF